MVLAAFALASGPAFAGFQYLGSASCETCHKEIYNSWKKSIHAKTFDLLPPKVRADKKKEASLEPGNDYRKDKLCMKCHVTGWGAGGYSFENPSDAWKGVGCESCHGPAEVYKSIHLQDSERRERKLKQAGLFKPLDKSGPGTCPGCHYDIDSPYKSRDPGRERNWADPKLRETYHIITSKK